VGTRSQIKGLPQEGEKELPQNRSRNNHQGLGNALIRPEPEHAGAQGEVHRRSRLGRRLNYYYRKAA
jgi:hypothetical protein